MENNNHIQFCIKDTYSYYFRIKTPAKFKKFYPGFKKEIKKSLRTSSPNEARKISSLWYANAIKQNLIPDNLNKKRNYSA